MERATFFHANNCAFRSEVFLAHPFPDLPIYRGQCSVLCHRLEESGISIYLQKKARVAHPVPQTAWYFLARAMNNGRDEVLVQDLVARRNRPPLRTVFWNFRAGMLKSFRKIRGHARDVQLTPVAAVATYAVALAYFGSKAIGELITHLRPNLVARLFPVQLSPAPARRRQARARPCVPRYGLLASDFRRLRQPGPFSGTPHEGLAKEGRRDKARALFGLLGVAPIKFTEAGGWIGRRHHGPERPRRDGRRVADPER